MALKFDVQSDVKKLIASNENLRHELLKASARALNRTADNVRAAAVREIAQREGIKATDVRRYVRVTVRARYKREGKVERFSQGASSLTARVSADGRTPNLIEFVSKASRLPSAFRSRDGVVAHVHGADKVYRGTFIVRARNGKMVVVSRSVKAKADPRGMRPLGSKGKWRPKWSKGIYGPPPSRTFATNVIMQVMEQVAKDRWAINWAHESKRVLSAANGGDE